MSFAKIPGQAPPFDATALAKTLKLTDAQTKQLVAWKRFMESSNEYDGAGLRDIVAANAQGLNAVKGDNDRQDGQLTQLFERVTALEARPQVPFPGSGPPGAGV